MRDKTLDKKFLNIMRFILNNKGKCNIDNSLLCPSCFLIKKPFNLYCHYTIQERYEAVQNWFETQTIFSQEQLLERFMEEF